MRKRAARARAEGTAGDGLIHPMAMVHAKAALGPGVRIGPYSVIDQHVVLGARTTVGAHCVIEGRTTIGEDCEIFAGAVIGSIPQDLKYRGEASVLRIGDRNKIREYVTVNSGTESGGGQTVIGSDCLLMAYAHVAHDCRVGNHVIMANSVALAGHITVEDRVVIGGLVGIHQFVRVGTLALIGGCSRVNQDIPPYSTCVGYPASVLGPNSEGLRRAGVSREVRTQLHHAFKILFHSQRSLRTALKELEREPAPSAELAHLLAFVRASKRGVTGA